MEHNSWGGVIFCSKELSLFLIGFWWGYNAGREVEGGGILFFFCLNRFWWYINFPVSHFLITNFFHKNVHQKFFQYFYTKMVTQNFINDIALKWSPQTFCNVFILKSYQKCFSMFFQ